MGCEVAVAIGQCFFYKFYACRIRKEFFLRPDLTFWLILEPNPVPDPGQNQTLKEICLLLNYVKVGNIVTSGLILSAFNVKSI